MRKTVRFLWTVGALLLVLILAAACTRDRSTPEPTETPIAAGEPSVTQVAPEDATPTPEPSPTPTPTPEVRTIAYTVQPGDTLAGIAQKYDVDVETLRKINFLADDNLLAGQILRVPLKEGVTEEGVPTPTPEPYLYTIQEGDTLYSIAIQFGVPADQLIAANELVDPNNLIVGSQLVIPGYVAAEEPEGTGEEGAGGQEEGKPYIHVVQPGESLSEIALRYDVDPADIIAANNIPDPDHLVAGQELVIPGYQPPESQESGPVTHVVQPGETLSQIAQRYGVAMSEIMAANNITNPNLIKPGQELVIPGITQAEAQAANRTVHVVQPGETLLDIARQYGVSLQELIRANNIGNPNLIKPGEELVIPTP